MSRPHVCATFTLLHTRGELRVNGISATPAWWAAGIQAGRVELDALVVRGWNRVEVWVDRDRDRGPPPGDKEVGADVSFYRLDPPATEMTGSYLFCAWSMHREIDIEPIGLGQVIDQRFWAGEDFRERSFESSLGLEARNEAAMMDQVRALHAALVAGDLRALARAYKVALDEIAESEERRRDLVEEEWLARLGALVGDEARKVEPLRVEDLRVELSLGGRVGSVRRADGSPALLIRSEGLALGLSPAFSRRDGELRLIR